MTALVLGLKKSCLFPVTLPYSLLPFYINALPTPKKGFWGKYILVCTCPNWQADLFSEQCKFLHIIQKNPYPKVFIAHPTPHQYKTCIKHTFLTKKIIHIFFLPTYLPYFFSDRYRIQTISFLGLNWLSPESHWFTMKIFHHYFSSVLNP